LIEINLKIYFPSKAARARAKPRREEKGSEIFIEKEFEDFFKIRKRNCS
jgi:hypothetical protein